MKTINYHKTIETYTMAAGQLSDKGVEAVAYLLWSYVARLRVSIVLSTIEEWTEAIERELTRANLGLSIPPLKQAIRQYWLVRGVSISFILGHPAFNWEIGPETSWEDNKQKLIKRWYRYFNSACPQYLHCTDRISQVMASISPAWLVVGKGETGTYPKRLAKALKREIGWQLTPSHLEEIGTIVKSHVSEQTEYHIRFDQDYLKGLPHEYCNGGSCWWGSFAASRYALHNAGGYAARMFDLKTNRVIGRVWCQPIDDDCCLIFNRYGDASLHTWARLLATEWGLSYGETTIDVDDDIVYVNNNSGIIIGPQDKIDKYVNNTILPPWEEVNTCICVSCECTLAEDSHNIMYDDNGESWCEDCFYEHHTECYECGEYTPNDDMRNEWCSECYDATHSACECCGDDTYDDDLDEEGYCPDCSRPQCVLCHDRCDTDDMRSGYCPDCYEEEDDETCVYRPISADGMSHDGYAERV